MIKDIWRIRAFPAITRPADRPCPPVLPPSAMPKRGSLRVACVAAGLAGVLALSACSTDALAPSDRTAGLEPVLAAPARLSTAPEAAPADIPPAGPAASPIPAEGVDVDAMVSSGAAAPVVGLAEEQSRDIHPPARQAGAGAGAGYPNGAAPPLVDGIGTSSLHVLAAPADAGAAPQAAAGEGADPDLPPLTPARRAMEARRQAQFLEQEQRVMRARRDRADEAQVAFLPRAGDPLSDATSAPGSGRRGGPLSQPDASGRMPAAEVACRQRLNTLGVTFRDVPRIANGPSCGIDYPIELAGLNGGIAVKPAVKLNCEVTEAFALWVRNELAPSARYRYLSGIATIKPLGGYSCRTMNSRRGAAMSEHAHGNAIDVGKFVLKSGKEIDVRKPGFFAFREKGLLKAVRQDSCKYFNTVLGPGSDPQHKDHFHFDLRNRASGYRHCD